MELKDKAGRKINYLRLSVTDRCNQQCIYCVPEEGIEFTTRENVLTLEELAGLGIRFITLFDINKIRLTGGEPLVRKNIEVLIEILSVMPNLKDIALTTNATMLSGKAKNLYAAGLKRINASLDSLSPERYLKITGGGNLEDALDGLKAAQDAGFAPIKINTVLLPGFSEETDFVEWANREGFLLRFIELMPGARNTSADSLGDGLKETEILRKLEMRFGTVKEISSSDDGLGKIARRYGFIDNENEFEIIPGVSVPFCGDCNRIRLDCQGSLRACLYSPETLQLKPLLYASDEEFTAAITEFIGRKSGRILGHIGSEMSSIGG